MPLQPNLFPTRCTQNQNKIKNHNSSKAIKQNPNPSHMQNVSKRSICSVPLFRWTACDAQAMSHGEIQKMPSVKESHRNRREGVEVDVNDCNIFQMLEKSTLNSDNEKTLVRR